MKEKFKNENGITLIALIITIIILLILAIVSINLVLNEGIIKRAENAVNAYNSAQTNELQQLNELENQLIGTESNKPTEPWYNLTEEEKTQLVNAGAAEIDENGNGYYVIAHSEENDCLYQLLLAIENGKSLYMQLQKATEKDSEGNFSKHSGLMYFTSEETVAAYQEMINSINPSLQLKINTFYYSPIASHFGEKETVEYAGNINDWIPQNGYMCESYMNRLIQNVNK